MHRMIALHPCYLYESTMTTKAIAAERTAHVLPRAHTIAFRGILIPPASHQYDFLPIDTGCLHRCAALALSTTDLL